MLEKLLKSLFSFNLDVSKINENHYYLFVDNRDVYSDFHLLKKEEFLNKSNLNFHVLNYNLFLEPNSFEWSYFVDEEDNFSSDENLIYSLVIEVKKDLFFCYVYNAALDNMSEIKMYDSKNDKYITKYIDLFEHRDTVNYLIKEFNKNARKHKTNKFKMRNLLSFEKVNEINKEIDKFFKEYVK